VGDAVQLGCGWRAAGDDDAIRSCLSLRGLLRAGEDLIGIEHAVSGNLCRGRPGLGTVGAVLSAPAALGVHEEVQVDPVAMPAVANAVGRRQHVEEFLVPGSQNREPFTFSESMPLEHPVRQFLPAAGKTRSLDQFVFDYVFHGWFPRQGTRWFS